jgi:prepilin-type N-terminal cleavage/methylation domain-containing protein
VGARATDFGGRHGFTLVELLVVIFIVLIISAVALPTIMPALSHRQVSEAARLLQGVIVGAHDSALKNGAPAGIRLLPDPAFPIQYATFTMPNGQGQSTQINPALPLAYNRIIPIETAPEYSDGFVSINGGLGNAIFSSTAALTYPVPNPNGSTGLYPYPGVNGGNPATPPPGGTVLMIEEAVLNSMFLPNTPTSWYWNIRIGDKIQINNAGPWYTVIGPMYVTPATGNVEMFANVGPPGTTSPLVRNPTNTGNPLVNPEFLFVVNGYDDNQDGWTDAGWDGVDNNGNGIVDELLEWNMGGTNGEVEAWLGTAATQAVSNVSYTIQRRPAPAANSREIALPTNVVIDATTWDYPNVTSANPNAIPSLERSRFGPALNIYTGYVDILLTPTGSVVPSYIYSTPASFSMSSSFYHFWLAERSDVYAPALNNIDVANNTAYPPYLPLPTAYPLPAGYSTLFPGGGAIKGEYRLVTLFSRTGQITTNEDVHFDTTGNIQGGSFNTNLPFLQAQQGVRGGQ